LSLIKVTRLSKTYKKGQLEIPALSDVSFVVGEGDFVSIVGRSGSGKSTLLNLLGGLDTPTSGQILFKDRDLAGMSRSELARHRRYTVGMVFQSFNLITHRTALENVALALTFGGVPRAERRSRASDLLSEVGLGGRLAHRPSELSGGEAQRVAIARALANRPEVLLLDEPTGNLDSSTSGEIIELVKGLNRDRGLTAIMVTHEHDIAESVSSRIIRLLDGTVDAISGQGAGT
jgi:putative ABC transport system ATP-binding protein